MTVLAMLFSKHLRLDVRFVDDKAGLWKAIASASKEKHESHEDHTKFLQRICGLDWESAKLSDSMTMLCLHCWIDRDLKAVKWKSCTKPESLFLQTPPHSEHAENARKGMTTSTMSRHWRHCSSVEDCIEEAHRHFQRLMDAGCDPKFLTPMFEEGSRNLARKGIDKNSHHKLEPKKMLHHQAPRYHPTHHSKDISSKQTQETFKETCGPVLSDLLDVKKLTVTCHRPKNLRDLLTPSKLRDCKGEKNQVEHHLKGTHLVHCAEELDCDSMRKEEIDKEKPSLQNQVERTNKLIDSEGQQLCCNPHRKKHFWRKL